MAVIIARHRWREPRTRLWAAAAVGLLVVLFIAWNWSGWRAAARVGAAYGARIGCACRYVEGRSEASCQADVAAESGMGLVSVNDDSQAKAVTGHVWLMARRTARLKPGFGCVLDPM